jgi:hypothetical protein
MRRSTSSGKEGVVVLESGRAARLARELRELRESQWPEVELTQAQLAKAFSGESKVAPATLSSWESLTNPKTPPPTRLSAYARFFATRRSLDGGPHLIPESKLQSDELERFQKLEERLLGLLHVEDAQERRTFAFDDGPVTIMCPETPPDDRSPLASASDPNFTKLQQYADQDALIEMFGHVRAENPTLEVHYRLPAEAVADDVSAHVILLGGIGWSRVTRRFQAALGQVPIKQVAHEQLDTGDIFTVAGPKGEKQFFPEWEDLPDGKRELIEDVALLARLRNPFNISRTLTICNGIHSRGVLGAVRCLTDASVREANEKFLAEHFPEKEYALLLRVPVVAGESISPYLPNADTRLFEWWPGKNAASGT